MNSSSRRVQLIIWGVIGVVALGAVLLISTAGSDGSGFKFLGQGEEEQAASDARDHQLVDHEGEEIPVEEQDSVEEFAADYGDPPGTDFARLRIPAINVNAPVGRWIVDAAVMPEPYGPVDVAFYDLTGWGGIGGFPGDGQNAVFGGHVDLNRDVAYAGTHYRGPAVFWALDQLKPGDIIEVDVNGETLSYSVVWQEQVSTAEGTDWRQYWSSDVAVDSITLFTCGGEFNFETLKYSHRTVVRAERI